MCGRYLIEEEAYADILEILYRSGTLPPIGTGPRAGDGADSLNSGQLPPAMREAMAVSMFGDVQETVPGRVHDLFPGATGSCIVVSGEVFPTNIAPVLVGAAAPPRAEDGIAPVKWGFPHWKNSSVIINARSETALEKQMFRKALLERRCVIPSSGFFEWGSGKLDILQVGMLGSGTRENVDFTRNRRGRKIKYLLRLPDEGKLYMAGFWNTFKDINGEYTAFVILTTAASRSVAAIHDRMPLILSPDEKDDWLSSAEFMQYALLRPGPELELSAA